MEIGSLTRIDRIRLGVALIGIAVWITAVKFDDATARVVGMVLLGVALLLRFVPRRLTGDNEDPENRD